MADNPFKMVYKTLYDMIAERDDFKALVEFGNQIRFDNDENRDPIKLEVSSADLPEVTLVATTIRDINLYSTSSSTELTREYSWMIATGDLRINQIFDIEWIIFVGMLGWQEKLTALQWCGQSFVKRVGILEVTNGFSDPEANRGIIGWSALWTCEVQMYFVTKDLKDGCP